MRIMMSMTQTTIMMLPRHSGGVHAVHAEMSDTALVRDSVRSGGHGDEGDRVDERAMPMA